MPHPTARKIEGLHRPQAEINELLARLAALSDDYFNVAADEVNWGHVGTLEYYAARLRELSNSAFGEGEHAS